MLKDLENNSLLGRLLYNNCRLFFVDTQLPNTRLQTR